MNMYSWLNSLKGQGGKAAIPIVTYPALRFLNGATVGEMLTDSNLQAQCVYEAAMHMPAAAALMPMDLSVEAECFGAQVRISDSEIPAVTKPFITDIMQAYEISVPPVNSCRIPVCLDAIKKTLAKVCDRPVFAGVIGSFSLAGRLSDVTEIMYYCYDEPQALHELLKKCTEFIIKYIIEIKKTGANGVFLCEPLAGMLSPALEREFSAEYIKLITLAVQDENFIVVYHNCGNGVAAMIDSLIENECVAYHFGNSVSLAEMLKKMPDDKVIMGNINPVGTVHDAAPEEVYNEVRNLCAECGVYPNFVLSTGCDVPPGTPWENITAFFDGAKGI